MKNKKTKIISIVSLITLALTVVGATYAYFQAQTGEGSSTDIKINANTTDVFTFETGTAIGLNLDQESFASGKGNQSGTTYAKAMLTANNKTNTATEHYYLYLNISSNTFIYSQDSSKPEILLKITDKNGTEVKPTLEGIEYKTVTDGKGVSQSGYDITTYNDVLPIYENKEITTTSSVTEQWNLSIIFINYDFNQSANAGKALSASLMIQKEELQYALGDVNGDGNIGITDVIRFMKYFDNPSLFNKYALLAADVNQDNIVNEIDFDILFKYNSNHSIGLPYKNKDAYNITYNLDGGTAAIYLRSKYSSEFESSLDFETNTFSKIKKDGYGFTGWTGSNGTTAEEEVTIEQGTTGDLSYTANWALLGDVNQDGKRNALDSLQLTKFLENETVSEKFRKDVADVNRDGEVDYLDYLNVVRYVSGDLTDISYFPEETYSITYDLDGGKFLNDDGVEYTPLNKYYSCDVTGGLPEPVKTGYTFLGWTGSNGDTPKTTVSIRFSRAKDLHYKANWQTN